MSPVAVIGLEIDASEYVVCSVAGIRPSRSAHPKPCSQMIRPPFDTATASDGTPLSMTAALAWARATAN